MARNLDASIDHRFSSRLGFLVSVIGIGVGTGNICRFSRIAAQNGSDEGARVFGVAWTALSLSLEHPVLVNRK